MLPTRGNGVGPGGRDGVEGLSFRSQTRTAMRRLAEAARTDVEGMLRGGRGG